MANPLPQRPAVQNVNIAVGPPSGQDKQDTKPFGEPQQKFIPKEGYELIAQLVRVNEQLGRGIARFLIGMDVVPDDDEPSGFKYIKLDNVIAFVNEDGFEKLSDFVLLAANPPLSYLHPGAKPEMIAGELVANMIKTIGTNFKTWGITNPSLIPMFASLAWEFITTAWNQHSELLDSLIPNAFPRGRKAEEEQKKEKGG